MSSQLLNLADGPARLSRWRVAGVDPATPCDGGLIAWMTGLFHNARHFAQRADAHDGPRTREELFSLARRFEREMPNLAAELRSMATHRAGVPD